MCRSRALLEDTRQQASKHRIKHAYWEREGVPVIRTKLVVGDYTTIGSSVFVDTKKDIYEVYSNLTQQHERFKRECVLAQNLGADLIILVENDEGVTDIDTLAKWTEDAGHFQMRRAKSTKKCVYMTGGRLAKAMSTMQERYGVRFEFCTPRQAGERVLSLLDYWGGEEDV